MVKLMFITRRVCHVALQPVTAGGEVKPWAVRSVEMFPNWITGVCTSDKKYGGELMPRIRFENAPKPAATAPLAVAERIVGETDAGRERCRGGDRPAVAWILRGDDHAVRPIAAFRATNPIRADE